MNAERHQIRRADTLAENLSMSCRNVPFEWKNREEEGWRGGAGRCGRIMIRNRRQGEAEPEGTRKDKLKSE